MGVEPNNMKENIDMNLSGEGREGGEKKSTPYEPSSGKTQAENISQEETTPGKQIPSRPAETSKKETNKVASVLKRDRAKQRVRGGNKKSGAQEAGPQAKNLTNPSAVNQPQQLKQTGKIATRKIAGKKKIKIHFFIRFHTHWGQSLYITAQHPLFGNGHIEQALPMQYWNGEFWTAGIELSADDVPQEGISYNYLVRGEDGSVSYDWGSDKRILPSLFTSSETVIIDAWNFAGFYENAFYTEPFQQVLLKNNFTPFETAVPRKWTHTFRVKAPLLQRGETVFIAGNVSELGDWGREKMILMGRKEGEDFFSVALNLSKVTVPVAYKYGIYDLLEKRIVRFEEGANRSLNNVFLNNTRTIVNDGFIVLPANTWKGAGIAIPVFSLRSENSCGVGEFTDLTLLVDWVKKTGLKLVQILPVNDTTATRSWTDSYPYAAISAFALHPMYLNLERTTAPGYRYLLEPLRSEQQRLNALDSVDYEAVNKLKWTYIRQLYPLQKDDLFNTPAYTAFFEQNRHWLVPYAAFCYLRDKYNTSDFNQWHAHKAYDATAIAALTEPGSASADELGLHFFVQFYLHEQLKHATQYAHDNGIILKGDIPIGIYRYGADAWQDPQLYHMDMQAGAPPDDFAVKGQNWGFPTYNWEKMREDDFAWWKQRFEQMSYYFDAFRIDHILGFFRIWSIPYHSVEGIMGHFEPALPIHLHELQERGIAFNENRYCRPYINDEILQDLFGDQQNEVRQSFLNYDGFGHYQLKAGFSTQRALEDHFSWLPDNEHNRWLKNQLFHVLSNVIMFEAEGSNGKQFHFRFSMRETSSFRYLDDWSKQQLHDLYIDYFFRRQDHFWMQKALEKLPALKRATNMLVCGEDLGLVPASVPEVMRQTGILSLEIQRMPKDPRKEFFHPADAPYLSVVTPSTHDMSTIRGWWEEDRNRTQRFYNNELGQWGEAPYFCDAWVNEAILVQHLYSPAMWAVFQLQDILGMDPVVRRPNPHEERINVPANPQHYWKYRMHLRLEDLLNNEGITKKLLSQVTASGRA